ncbi:type I-C CRISPR-associated protein Cas8c/Csd1 [Ralstonia pseudosolanacearum]
MILQALHAYYERRKKLADPRRRLPPVGLVEQAIGYLIEIERDGRLVQLVKTGSINGKKHEPARFLVPRGVKRTAGVAANLLWDNSEYVLGIDTRGRPERVREQHAAFCARLAELPEPAASDAGVRAARTFLASETERSRLAASPLWPEVLETNPIMTFRLRDDEYGGLVCQRPDVVAVQTTLDDEGAGEGGQAICLVTGKHDKVAILHPAIKGVWGAQTSGANIVSFNLGAFSSYGKQQGENAPVGETAAQTYTTALNALLARGSHNRIQIGDASTVFWSELDDDPLEAGFAELFGNGDREDDPDAGADKVAALFRAVHSGRYRGEEGNRCFHVLALAPNAARIAIRDYQCVPLCELAPRIAQHFADLAVAHGPGDATHLSLFRLLCAVALQGKADNIPPRLGGEVLRSVLTGQPYSRTLLNAAVVRCRAERKVGYARAALLKGWINRDIRYRRSEEKEFTEMLDPRNPNPGYRLGRLFATLERIQEDAQPGINATVRDRYYGSASGTPAVVFPALLRLSQHHLSKLKDKPGLRVKREQLLAEVIGGLSDFPAHLALADQGRFALGYYHQRQDFFTRAEPVGAANVTTEEH